MRTTEEIEKLAKKEYNYLTEYEQMHNQKIVVIDAYIDGYTQCQKDMADKKYTEAQMKACFYHNCIDNAKAMFEDYLKEYVLNKQD